MILNLFRHNRVSAIIIIPVLSVIIVWPSLFTQTQIAILNPDSFMPLYRIFISFVPQGSILSKIVLLFVLNYTGFYLVKINSSYTFLPVRTMLPALIFIITACSYSSASFLHPIYISIPFLLYAINKLFSSYKTERLSYGIFESALLVGTGSLIYFNLIWFTIIIWVALLVLRPVVWREWIFSILGLIIPFVLWFGTEFFVHGSYSSGIDTVVSNIKHQPFDYRLNFNETLFSLLIIVLIFFSIIGIVNSTHKMNVFTRKIYLLLVLLFVLITAGYLFSDTIGIEIIAYASVPLSFIVSHYLLTLKKDKWSRAILSGLIIASVLLAWLPLN